MLTTPSKDGNKNISPIKVDGKVPNDVAPSPFKTPGKGDDDKVNRDNSFIKSFGSDQMSLIKSLIENPYSSFISLQSEYFDTHTKVTTI